METITLKCPNCNAPVDADLEKSRKCTCEYCGTVFVLKLDDEHVPKNDKDGCIYVDMKSMLEESGFGSLFDELNFDSLLNEVNTHASAESPKSKASGVITLLIITFAIGFFVYWLLTPSYDRQDTSTTEVIQLIPEDDISFEEIINEMDEEYEEESGLLSPEDGILIHENEYFTIRFLGCEEGRDREYMVFFVENKTDVELTVQANTLAINGENLGFVSGSSSIAAQSRGRARFRTTDEFPTLTPSTITGTLTVWDFSNTLLESSYDVPFVNLEINGEYTRDSILEIVQDGIFVHEDDYVRLYYVGCEILRNSDHMVFFVVNKTDADLTFQSSTLAINGESLGHVSGSDRIAAQSRGRISFSTAEDFPTLYPDTITGTISVIDFNRSIFGFSYDVSFVNLEVG